MISFPRVNWLSRANACALAGSLFGALAGCAPPPADSSSAARLSTAAAGLLASRVPEDAVLGVISEFHSGELVDTFEFAASDLPTDLANRIATGLTDQEGRGFFEVQGASSEDGVIEYRYRYVKRSVFHPLDPTEAAERHTGALAEPFAPPKISPALEEQLSRLGPNDTIKVYIRLGTPLETSLRTNSLMAIESLAGAEEAAANRRSAINARKAEANRAEAPVIDLLRSLGASEIAGYWTSPGVSARVRKRDIEVLANEASIERIEGPATTVDMSASHWDGYDMNHASGLNKSVYHDAGFAGQAFANNPGGRYIKVGVIGGGFKADHPGFRDCVGCGYRVSHYDCTNGTTCEEVALDEGPAPQAHGTKTAGLAIGSIRQHQVSHAPPFTDAEELERTGMAEEVEGYLFAVSGDICTQKVALEWAAENGLDSVLATNGGMSATCDVAGICDFNDAVLEAQTLGTLLERATRLRRSPVPPRW